MEIGSIIKQIRQKVGLPQTTFDPKLHVYFKKEYLSSDLATPLKIF